jgi:hypothetical protein
MDDEFERLNRELMEAREDFHRAQERASGGFRLAADSDLLNPDSLSAAKGSQKALQQAWERYQEALNAYSEYRARR